MEIEIRRKETVGAGSSAHSELETLTKYEIMDGAPVRGESVPIRCVYVSVGPCAERVCAYQVCMCLWAPVWDESVPMRSMHVSVGPFMGRVCVYQVCFVFLYVKGDVGVCVWGCL